MRISDNILVGVNIKRYVDFFTTIIAYTEQLVSIYPELDEHDLVGLVVNNDDKSVYEYYYTKFQENLFLTVSISNIETREVEWSSVDLVTSEQMFENIRKHKEILSLDYYLKNI